MCLAHADGRVEAVFCMNILHLKPRVLAIELACSIAKPQA